MNIVKNNGKDKFVDRDNIDISLVKIEPNSMKQMLIKEINSIFEHDFVNVDISFTKFRNTINFRKNIYIEITKYDSADNENDK